MKRLREEGRDFGAAFRAAIITTTLLRLAFVAGVLSVASGHGCNTNITMDGTTYPGLSGDSCTVVPPNSIILPPVGTTTSGLTATYGGVVDFSSAQLACGQTTHKAAAATAKIAAGKEVTWQWTSFTAPIAIDHFGPILTYLAKCDSTCDKADPTRLKWFKIAEDGYTDDWGTYKMHKNGDRYTTTIPASVSPGEHEAFVLQWASSSTHQAQAFSSCSQVQITGGGTCYPSDDYLVNFPGAYGDDANGPVGVIWAKGVNGAGYIPPGPKVWTPDASCTAIPPPVVPPPAGGSISASAVPSGGGNSTSMFTNVNIQNGETEVNKFPVVPVAAGVGGGLGLILICCLFFCCRKSRTEGDQQRQSLQKIIAARVLRDRKDAARDSKSGSMCSTDKHGSAPPAYPASGAASTYGDEKAGAIAPPVWPAPPAASEHAGSEAYYQPSTYAGAPVASSYGDSLAGANPFETYPYASSHYANSAAGAKPYGGAAPYLPSAYAASSVAGSLDSGRGARSAYAASERSYGTTGDRSCGLMGHLGSRSARSTRSGSDAGESTITPDRYAARSTRSGSDVGETVVAPHRPRRQDSAYAASSVAGSFDATGSRRGATSDYAASSAAGSSDSRGRSRSRRAEDDQSRASSSRRTGTRRGRTAPGDRDAASSRFASSEAGGSYYA